MNEAPAEYNVLMFDPLVLHMLRPPDVIVCVVEDIVPTVMFGVPEKFVAVAALPVHEPELPEQLPVTLPVNAPVKVVA